MALKVGRNGNDRLSGTASNDTLAGLNGNDILIGNNGNDTLIGGNGRDRLIGGNGRDYMDGGTGADIMEGGTGDDIYIVDSVKDVIREQGTDNGDLVASFVSLNIGAIGGIENAILLGKANRSLTGGDDTNLLKGNTGKNTLTGNGGNDQLSGQAGNDTLFGGTGDDIMDGGTGADQMVGGIGNDVYIVDNIGDRIFEIVGTDGGSDRIFASISIDLNKSEFGNGEVETAVLSGSKNLNIEGTAKANVLVGNAGNNVINGQDGNDIIIGGDGDDTITGGLDNDNVTGGKGSDIIILTPDTVINGSTKFFVDTYVYKKGDLDGGAIDIYKGKFDGRSFASLGNDKLDISDLITITSDEASNAISDFISKELDGQGGEVYFIDLDGGGSNFSSVPFAHFLEHVDVVNFVAGSTTAAI